MLRVFHIVIRKLGHLEVFKIIKARKFQYSEHMFRGKKYQLLQLIKQGKICGKRSRGRPKTNWLQYLREWFQYNSKELFSIAKDKDCNIVMMISNFR